MEATRTRSGDAIRKSLLGVWPRLALGGRAPPSVRLQVIKVTGSNPVPDIPRAKSERQAYFFLRRKMTALTTAAAASAEPTTIASV